MKTEEKIPRKTYLKIFFVLLLIYGAFTFIDYQNKLRRVEEKQRQLKETQLILDQANLKLNQTKKILKHSLPSAESVSIGKTSNFEGPNVVIHAIVWNGTTYSEKDRHEINQNGGMLYMKQTQASWTPIIRIGDCPH